SSLIRHNQVRMVFFVLWRRREVMRSLKFWLVALVLGALLLAGCQAASATTQPAAATAAPTEAGGAATMEATEAMTQAATGEATQAATTAATEAGTEAAGANQTTMCTDMPAPASLPDLGGKDVTIAVENAYPPFNSKQGSSGGIGWDYDA